MTKRDKCKLALMNSFKLMCDMSAKKSESQQFMNRVLLLFLVINGFQNRQVNAEKDAVELAGDIVIGGLFPLHKKSELRENECGVFSETPGYHFMEAMLYAIDKINKDPKILPNVTLGAAIYDTCQSTTIAAERAKRFIQMTLGRNKAQFAGVVGALSSGVSETIANFLRVFEIPQISYSATSVILSNKDVYSYFLRTVPPDSFQAHAIVDIIHKFGWSYVSTVNSAGVYGAKGIEMFWKRAEENGICIDERVQLSSFPSPAEYEDVIAKLHSADRRSNVVVVIATQTEIRNLLEASAKSGNTRRLTWIGSDGWSNSVDVTETAEDAALGAITIMMRKGEIAQEFIHYFYNLTLENYPRKNKRFFTEFWESHFLCNVVATNESNQTSMHHDYTRSCRGSEKLQDTDIEISPIRIVINAVNAFAHALDNLQKELCPNEVGICPAMTHFERPRLLQHLKNVSFPDPFVNATVKFDENYEVSAMYDIMNFRKENGAPHYIQVGTWDGEYVGNELRSKLILDKSVQWLQGVSQVPESYCSKDCNPYETRQPIPTLDFKCCWTCQHCQELQIVLNNTCRSGPEGWMPNINRTGWEKRKLVYPKWSDALSVILILVSLFSLALTMLTALVFIVYKDNRLLKASGRELCFVMLAGIALCFIVPFLYIAKPNNGVCYARGLVIGLALAMCYAPLFMKINRIYRIFTNAKSSAARPALVTPRIQLLITLGLVLIQLMFTALWFIAKPVQAVETYIPRRKELMLECKVDELSFSVNLCYVMILMILCTAYAFKTRHFPKNFNESKYIGISMYITCAVWMFFFPFYLNTQHSVKQAYLVASACVVIGLVTLVGLFAQKVYIVFFVKEISNEDLALGSQRKESALSSEEIQRKRLDHELQ